MKTLLTFTALTVFVFAVSTTGFAQYYGSGSSYSGGGVVAPAPQQKGYSYQQQAPSGPIDYSNLSGKTDEQRRQEEQKEMMLKQQATPAYATQPYVATEEEDPYDAARRQEREKRANITTVAEQEQQMKLFKQRQEEYNAYIQKQKAARTPTGNPPENPLDIQTIQKGLNQGGIGGGKASK